MTRDEDKTKEQLIDELKELRTLKKTELREIKYKGAAEARRRMEAIVQSLDNVIISTTSDGIVSTWNPGAERIYGYSAEEAIGRSIAFLVPPEKQDELTWLLEKTRRGESINSHETVRIKKDGTRIYVSLTISPVTDPGGGG